MKSLFSYLVKDTNTPSYQSVVVYNKSSKIINNKDYYIFIPINMADMRQRVLKLVGNATVNPELSKKEANKRIDQAISRGNSLICVRVYQTLWNSDDWENSNIEIMVIPCNNVSDIITSRIRRYWGKLQEELAINKPFKLDLPPHHNTDWTL